MNCEAAVVAVVGATGGLGREISTVLTERGATVVRVGRNQLADLQIDLRDSTAGDELVAYCADRSGDSTVWSWRRGSWRSVISSTPTTS